MVTFTFGKSLFTLVALGTMIGPYIADWNETHVLNPTWPPHARFHNGQTMSLGLFLGLSIIYYLHLAPTSNPDVSHSTSLTLRRTYLNIALLLVHAYYVPAISGILYPGAAWMDPEFGDGHPQVYIFSAFMGFAWVGWCAERRNLLGIADVKKK